MPGTTSNAIPSRTSASSSSPPRPNTKLSPPFRRTTVFPCFASSTKIWLISCCGTGWLPAFFPTLMRFASCATSSRTSAPTSLSYTTTCAPAINSLARSVKRSASPGPAPTRYTVPLILLLQSSEAQGFFQALRHPVYFLMFFEYRLFRCRPHKAR